MTTSNRSFCLVVSVLAVGGGEGCSSGAGGAGGTAGTGGTGLLGLDRRPENRGCHAFDRPVLGGSLTTVSQFGPGSGFGQLLDLQRGPPEYPAWWGITQSGDLLVLDDGDTGPADTVLTSTDLTRFTSGGETGLLGLAIDPRFPNATSPTTLRVYLNYTGSCFTGELCTRVSRFTLTATGSPAAYTAGPEEVLLRVLQPRANHNGGALRFGPDDYLYISFGDGGGSNDPWCSAQNLRTPLGKVLRIDVHSTPTGYTIPAGNPFRAPAGNPGAIFPRCNDHVTEAPNGSPDLARTDPCPEVLAYGLRNPFRMSFDRATGWLWLGDVGQNEVEEVDTFDALLPSTGYGVPNHNFGWPLREGPDNLTNAACTTLSATYPLDTDPTPPVYYYRHSDNGVRGAVVGGSVYRGTELGPAYFGRFFFSEAYTGEVWAMPNPYTTVALDVDGLEEPPVVFGYGFTEDDDGEVILLAAPPRRFILSGDTAGGPPPLLSQTGCVDPQDPTRLAPGLIPYGVRSALWSDGAHKTRAFAIPDGTTIDRSADGDFDLPIGSVVVKVFRAPSGDLLETRLLMRHDDGDWTGYTYVWDADQDDAILTLDATPIPAHDWTAPSRGDCLTCHTAAAGRTLGLEEAQLNGNFTYPSTGRTHNQLATLSAIGVFSMPLPDPSASPRLPNPLDPRIAPGDAARSYLHVNCSNCHRPSGTTPSPIDLRYDVALADTLTCDALPTTLTWPAAYRILAPGSAADSLLAARTAATDTTRMPPLATDVVDAAGLAVLETWIDGLGACP